MYSSAPVVLDRDAIFSLGVVLSLMPAAQFIASASLPKNVPHKYKYLFIWHTYDFLTHFIVEGSYLYHCFFSYVDLPPAPPDCPYPPSLTTNGIYFLGQKSRQYGANYSTGPMARLWQEYAKADHRWGGVDLGIISIEILTVGLAGPCAMYIAYLVHQVVNTQAGREKAGLVARMWFLATILATGELYGGEIAHDECVETKSDNSAGFMTFSPEWLSGNTQLAGNDPVYLWLYLVFFNVLWVFIPAWVLWEAWRETTSAFAGAAQMTGLKKGN